MKTTELLSLNYNKNIDIHILKYLYSKKNDVNFFDVSLIFRHNLRKNDIDNCVLELENNGYVTKQVKGKVGNRAVPIGGDQTDANNSRCKITSNGITYVVNNKALRTTNTISVFTLILSVIAILFSALQYFKPH